MSMYMGVKLSIVAWQIFQRGHLQKQMSLLSRQLLIASKPALDGEAWRAPLSIYLIKNLGHLDLVQVLCG